MYKMEYSLQTLFLSTLALSLTTIVAYMAYIYRSNRTTVKYPNIYITTDGFDDNFNKECRLDDYNTILPQLPKFNFDVGFGCISLSMIFDELSKNNKINIINKVSNTQSYTTHNMISIIKRELKPLTKYKNLYDKLKSNLIADLNDIDPYKEEHTLFFNVIEESKVITGCFSYRPLLSNGNIYYYHSVQYEYTVTK